MHYQLAKDKTLKLVFEHLFEIMEAWIQVLFMHSQITQVLVVIVFWLHVEVIRDCSVLATGGSPLRCILADWSIYSHHSMSKEELFFHCNTVWPMYVLDCGENGP